MILLTHPTGNTFVRGLLQTLQERGLLEEFYTALGFSEGETLAWAPSGLRQELLRRSYAVPAPRLRRAWGREALRLAGLRLGWDWLVGHERGWACTDAVYGALDRTVANHLRRRGAGQGIRGVYAYEDGALETFRAARELGITRFYELPIAYWETGRRLLQEEAQRWPEWEPTLQGTRDSAAKLERKTEELLLAEHIVCPSLFVQRTLPEAARARSLVSEFGSAPSLAGGGRPPEDIKRPLQVLFAGSMTQRKGLADLLAALRLLKRRDVVLRVMGSPLMPMTFYRSQGVEFIHEPTRPHGEVLALMRQCDLLALPSIVEGRALVQQEALSCGLPLLVTANAGGEDLVEPGRTGFLIPMRSPEAIAERIDWFAGHRTELAGMREPARNKAAELTWNRYGQKIADMIQSELPLRK